MSLEKRNINSHSQLQLLERSMADEVQSVVTIKYMYICRHACL